MGQELSNCCKKEQETQNIIYPTTIQPVPGASPFNINDRVNGIA